MSLTCDELTDLNRWQNRQPVVLWERRGVRSNTGWWITRARFRMEAKKYVIAWVGHVQYDVNTLGCRVSYSSGLLWRRLVDFISLNNIKYYQCRCSTTRFLAPSRSSGIYVLPLFFYMSFIHPLPTRGTSSIKVHVLCKKMEISSA